MIKKCDFGCQCTIYGKWFYDMKDQSVAKCYTKFNFEMSTQRCLVSLCIRYGAFILIDVIGKIEKAMAKTSKSNNFTFGSLMKSHCNRFRKPEIRSESFWYERRAANYGVRY